jgi:hypothetical protein
MAWQHMLPRHVFLNTENISAFVGFSWKIEIEMHGATMKKIAYIIF